MVCCCCCCCCFVIQLFLLKFLWHLFDKRQLLGCPQIIKLKKLKSWKWHWSYFLFSWKEFFCHQMSGGNNVLSIKIIAFFFGKMTEKLATMTNYSLSRLSLNFSVIKYNIIDKLDSVEWCHDLLLQLYSLINCQSFYK